MIVGLGYDLCEISRMEKSLQSPSFFKRVFGLEEQQALLALADHRRLESAAASFAAKEAFLKAAGVGLGGFDLADIQALRLPGGQPYYALSGSALQWLNQQGLQALLSLTHEAGLAGAVALLQKMPKEKLKSE